MSHRYSWVPVALGVLLFACLVGLVVSVIAAVSAYAELKPITMQLASIAAFAGVLIHVGLWMVAIDLLVSIDKGVRFPPAGSAPE